MKFDSLLLIPVFVFATTELRAQQYITHTNADSSIQVTKAARVDELIRKQKEINQQKQTIPGYRIQIFFGANRAKAQDVKTEFSSRHPDKNAYLTYQQPNFKVRIGDFRTRLEAQKFLKDIQGMYVTSFIVPDEVRVAGVK